MTGQKSRLDLISDAGGNLRSVEGIIRRRGTTTTSRKNLIPASVHIFGQLQLATFGGQANENRRNQLNASYFSDRY